MYAGLHVKCLLFFRILVKFLSTEFHENPSSLSRFAPYGRTDMIKRAVAIRKCFANALNNKYSKQLNSISYSTVTYRRDHNKRTNDTTNITIGRSTKHTNKSI